MEVDVGHEVDAYDDVHRLDVVKADDADVHLLRRELRPELPVVVVVADLAVEV